jgi:hypothetical protein
VCRVGETFAYLAILGQPAFELAKPAIVTSSGNSLFFPLRSAPARQSSLSLMPSSGRLFVSLNSAREQGTPFKDMLDKSIRFDICPSRMPEGIAEIAKCG